MRSHTSRWKEAVGERIIEIAGRPSGKHMSKPSARVALKTTRNSQIVRPLARLQRAKAKAGATSSEHEIARRALKRVRKQFKAAKRELKLARKAAQRARETWKELREEAGVALAQLAGGASRAVRVVKQVPDPKVKTAKPSVSRKSNKSKSSSLAHANAAAPRPLKNRISLGSQKRRSPRSSRNRS
jgi:hypothetical protein